MDWERFWEEYPRRFDDTEFRRQGGRTARGGVPTPAEELEVVLAEAVERLELGRSHRLLDLCCGNGYLTERLAAVAREVVGVDFSEPMLEIARRFHGGDASDGEGSVRYVQGSVLELDEVLGPPADVPPFDRVCMLESLHYFEPHQLGPMLAGIVDRTTPEAVVYLSGVTDAARKDNFFDTPERRAEHRRRKAEGTDVMGHWWRKDEIEGPAERLGMRCEFHPQNPALNTAHYRFDVVLRKG